MTTFRVPAAIGALTLSLALVGCGSESPPQSHAPVNDRVGGVHSSDTRWTLGDIEGADTSLGEIELDRADGAEAKVNWRKAALHEDYLADRADLGAGKPAQILGQEGLMFTYSADDHTVIRPVEGDAFIEVRVEGVDKAGFQEFLDSLRFATG